TYSSTARLYSPCPDYVHLHAVSPLCLRGSSNLPCQPLSHSFDLRSSSLTRLVAKIRRQAFFDLCNRRACARGIVFHLVARDFTDSKVSRFRMREIKSAYARTRMHRERFRKLDAAAFLRPEQTEKRTFLRVIGTGRITRGRADPAIFFAN